MNFIHPSHVVKRAFLIIACAITCLQVHAYFAEAVVYAQLGPATAAKTSAPIDNRQSPKTPGQFLLLPGPSGAPYAQVEPGSLRAYLKDNTRGNLWVVPAEAPMPRGLVGFTVPQVPKGDYVIWFEGRIEKAEVKGQEILISVMPRLELDRPTKLRAGINERLSVTIKIAGPSTLLSPARSASVTERAGGRIQVQSLDTSLADLDVGQNNTLPIDAEGRALFNIVIKQCGPARFRATADGYEPVNFAIDCPPEKPLPVVFIPGTAGSKLGLADGKLYWLNENSFLEGVLCKGNLDMTNTKCKGAIVKLAGILDAANLRLPGGITSLLRSFGLLEKVELKNGKKEWVFNYQVYKEFIQWANDNLRCAASKGGLLNCQDSVIRTAPYDWRLGAGEESNAQLDIAINDALAAANAGSQDVQKYQKVLLIAHSLGGIVSREYIATRGRERVAALVAVGTPWLGAPKAARAVKWGYDFGAGRTIDIGRQTTLTQEMEDGKVETKTVRNPLTFSFLNPTEITLVAKTWPAVFQMIPSRDFMRSYGKASTPTLQSKSVMWGWGENRTIEYFRAVNPQLFDTAEEWKNNRLFQRDDYGVKNYIIAGFVNRNATLGSLMDMQMNTVPRDFRDSGNERLKRASRFFGRFLGKITRGIAGVGLYYSDYIPVETDYYWGDGTTPLLSGSVGYQLRGDVKQEDIDTAKQYLGESTEVTVLGLNEEYEHGNILDDPKVRWNLFQDYRRENELLGVNVDAEVKTIELELRWNTTRPVKKLAVSLAGMKLKVAKETTKKQDDEYISTISFELPMKDRTLRLSDLLDKRFVIEGRDAGTMTYTKVQLLLNRMEVINMVGQPLTEKQPVSLTTGKDIK